MHMALQHRRFLQHRKSIQSIVIYYVTNLCFCLDLGTTLRLCLVISPLGSASPKASRFRRFQHLSTLGRQRLNVSSASKSYMACVSFGWRCWVLLHWRLPLDISTNACSCRYLFFEHTLCSCIYVFSVHMCFSRLFLLGILAIDGVFP